MKVAVASSADTPDAQMDPRFGRCAYFVIVDTESGEFEAIQNPGPQMGSGAGISAAQIVGDSEAEAVVAGNYGPNAAQALEAGGVQMFQASGMTVGEAATAAANGDLQQAGGATTQAHAGMGGQAAGGSSPTGQPGGMPGGGGMPGAGRGMGGGMGQGRGMGAGRGQGAAPGQGPQQPGPQMGPMGPMGGQMGPMGGQMGPMGGQMGPMGPMGAPGQMGPMGGQMPPEAQEEMRQYHLSMLRAQANMLQQQLEFIQSQIEYLESQGD